MQYPERVIQPAKIAYDGFWAALDWLYPPYCAGCGNTGSLRCQDCQNAIDIIPLNGICQHCDHILNKNVSERKANVFADR